MTTAPTELKTQTIAITPAMKERAAALLTFYGIKDGAYDLGHDLLASCLSLSALEPQSVDDAMVERMARAHDKEEAAQRGEPSPWDDPTIDAAWIAERITCMRAALQAAKEPSHD